MIIMRDGILTKELKRKMLFFAICEDNSTSRADCIDIMTSNGKVHSIKIGESFFGFCEKNDDFCYTYEKIEKFFPIIKECKVSIFSKVSRVDKDWFYLKMGAGNHLFVKSSVYDEFSKKIENITDKDLCDKWIDIAKEMIKENKSKKVKNGITEVVFIIDKSGSMSGYESDTIGGFNATIEKQRKIEGKVLVSTILFNDEVELLYDRVDINKISKMTLEEYQVGGCTALLDALGGSIRKISSIHKNTKKESIPEHTIFVITTDGYENASTKFDSNLVKEMIEEKTEEYGWEFIFLGANIDAVETADMYGIRKSRAADFTQSAEGVEVCYSMINDAISCVRKKESLDDGKWKKD